MANWWFTSDLHFGHEKIIKLCNRPFDNLDEMDDHLTWMWNINVKGGDNVVVVGDYCWKTKLDDAEYYYTRHLNGNKIFVKGNHDSWLRKRENKRYMYNKKINGLKVACCHYPMFTWWGKRTGGVNLHGHSHGRHAPIERQLDVGVDSAAIILGAYRPFHFDEIKYLLT